MKFFPSLLICLWLAVTSHAQNTSLIPPTDTASLHGYEQIKTASALVLDVAEVNGVVAFALAQNVQLYLADIFIATIPYQTLTGGSQNDRSENVLLIPDSINNTIYVIDDTGIGVIHCNNQRSEKLFDFHHQSLNNPNDTLGIGDGTEILDAHLTPDGTLNVFFPCLAMQDSISVVAAKKGSNQVTISYKDKKSIGRLAMQVAEGTTTGERQLFGSTNTPLFEYEFWDMVEISRSSTNNSAEYLVATKNEGLYQIEVKEGIVTKRAYSKLVAPDGTPLKKLRSITYLKEQDAVFIGTIGQHAYLLSLAQNRVFKTFMHSNQVHFWSSCAVDSNYYVAGNDSGTLFLLDAVTNIPQATLALGDFMIRSLMLVKEERDTVFWAGTSTGDIIKFRVDVANKRMSIIDTIHTESGVIYDFHQQGDRVFVATKKGLGQILTGSFTLLNATKDITFISESFTANGFFYGGEHSLYFWNETSNNLIQDLPELKNDFISNVISFKIGNRFFLIICIRNDFFYWAEWDNATMRIRPHTLRHFAANEGLTYFTPDGTTADLRTIYGGVAFDSTIWLSSNFGLLEYDIYEDRIYFYQHTGSVLEHNTGAFHRQTDSTAFLGTLNGTVGVNIKQAITERQQINQKLQPQIWEIKNNLVSQDSVFVNHIIYQKLQPDTTYRIAYEETDRRFWVLAPNYSLLQRNEFFLHTKLNDSLRIFDNQILKTKELLGNLDTIPWLPFGWVTSSKFPELKTENNQVSLRFIQFGSSSLTAKIMGILASILIVILIILKGKAEDSKRQLEQQKAKYNLRRELFVQLQNKLSQAQGYPDIQKAFRTITPTEMKETLQATKITLYKYESGQEELRILGHNESSSSKEELLANNVQQKTLNLTTDQNYPAVYFWNQLSMEQADHQDFMIQRPTAEENIVFYRLLANNATQDFYIKHRFDRPKPIIGSAATESFIFLLIGTPQHPYGLITIQNEEVNMFKQADREKEYLDLLSTLGGMLEFKMREIDTDLQAGMLTAFNDLFKQRMKTHFLKNVVNYPVYSIYDDLVNDGNELKEIYNKAHDAAGNVHELMKEMFEFKPVTELWKEVELCEKYIQFYTNVQNEARGENLVVEQLSTGINEENSPELIPSFILVNLVQNCVKYNKGKKESLEIQISKKDEAHNTIIMVRDNGQGFPSPIPTNPTNSTAITQRFFEKLEQFTEVRVTIERYNDNGAVVKLILPKKIQSILYNIQLEINKNPMLG